VVTRSTQEWMALDKMVEFDDKLKDVRVLPPLPLRENVELHYLARDSVGDTVASLYSMPPRVTRGLGSTARRLLTAVRAQRFVFLLVAVRHGAGGAVGATLHDRLRQRAPAGCDGAHAGHTRHHRSAGAAARRAPVDAPVRALLSFPLLSDGRTDQAGSPLERGRNATDRGAENKPRPHPW
jgi:hypothetical protein